MTTYTPPYASQFFCQNCRHVFYVEHDIKYLCPVCFEHLIDGDSPWPIPPMVDMPHTRGFLRECPHPAAHDDNTEMCSLETREVFIGKHRKFVLVEVPED